MYFEFHSICNLEQPVKTEYKIKIKIYNNTYRFDTCDRTQIVNTAEVEQWDGAIKSCKIKSNLNIS